jgi:hypothetical protein
VTGDAWNAIHAIGDRLLNTLDAMKGIRAKSLRGLVAKACVADLEYRVDGNVHSEVLMTRGWLLMIYSRWERSHEARSDPNGNGAV